MFWDWPSLSRDENFYWHINLNLLLRHFDTGNLLVWEMKKNIFKKLNTTSKCFSSLIPFLKKTLPYGKRHYIDAITKCFRKLTWNIWGEVSIPFQSNRHMFPSYAFQRILGSCNNLQVWNGRQIKITFSSIPEIRGMMGMGELV